jgi:hypothetical protein
MLEYRESRQHKSRVKLSELLFGVVTAAERGAF